MRKTRGAFPAARLILCGLAISPAVIGSAYGAATDARFSTPQGLALDASGNLYVADLSSSRIRKIATNGAVTTLAGGTYGMADGTGAAAKFAYPSGIAVDAVGNLFVVDQNNHNVRKVTPAGVVTTFAGTADGTQFGTTDGIGTAARFNGAAGIGIDTSGNLYVADYNNNSLRKITPAAVVTTVATGLQGAAAVALDASGIAYVACANDGTIMKVTADGSVSTFLTGLSTVYSTGGPQGVAVALHTDPSNNLYITDAGDSVVYKVSSVGVKTVLAGTLHSASSDHDGVGTAATFDFPTGIAVYDPSTLYVADYNASTIRKISISGTTATVTTYAGKAYDPGTADAVGALVTPAVTLWHVALAGLVAIVFLLTVQRRRARSQLVEA